jgi:predicted SnoaL-like aldol condensation-catalyzing enzyme
MNKKLENAINLYLEGIRDGKPREAVDKYTGERYTQHSTGVRDGKEGFIEFFEPFIQRNQIRDINVVRSIVDGQYVFLHVFQSLNNGETKWVTTDFFDTDENDRIIEHWDVISAFFDQTGSDHTSIDGPTEIVDLDKTEENKQLVRNFIQDILMPNGNPSKLEEYVSSDQFIQHKENENDGIEYLRRLSTGVPRSLNYKEIVLLVGQGNFIATLCKVHLKDETSDQEYAQVDVFRIEHGKIVEHWENEEPVPPEEETVNSGKF